MPFGDVRQRAYKIMPKDALQSAGQRLRLAECPQATLPKRLQPYLLRFDADGQPSGLHADRYEFWLYRQVRKRLKSGELYLDDSLQHRCFSDELVSLDAKADVLSQMDIPWLRQPIEAQLNELATELRAQWLAFNRELPQGKLKHLDYDSQTKTLTWRKPQAAKHAAREEAFYEQLSFCDVADVIRFVNAPLCHLLLANVTRFDSCIFFGSLLQRLPSGNTVNRLKTSRSGPGRTHWRPGPYCRSKTGSPRLLNREGVPALDCRGALRAS